VIEKRERCQLREESGMAGNIEGAREIKGDEVNIGLGFKHRSDCIKEGDESRTG
jgi:hypothetical protein